MPKHAVYEIASFKALPSDDKSKGRFSALVSVFGNVDLQGDRVVPGAFGKSLARWRESGDPVPLIWSHNWGDPNAHIGYASADDIEETDDGLLVKDGVLDLDNPFASQVYRLLKERRVREFSFSYAINDERKGKDGATELLDLDLIEAGPTLKGANPSTELLSVKSALEAAAKGEEPTGDPLEGIKTLVRDVVQAELGEDAGSKAGRTISKANESRLRSARDAIEEVLSSLGETESEKHEDEDEAEGKSSDDVDLDIKSAVAAAKTRR